MRSPSYLLTLCMTTAAIEAEVFPLDDQVQVRYVGATWGTNHFAPGQRLRKIQKQLPPIAGDLMGRFLPSSRLQAVECQTEEDSLGFWFSIANSTNRNGLWFPVVRFWPDLVPLAADGFPIGRWSSPWLIANQPYMFKATVYPRRQKSVTFEFRSADGPQTGNSARFIRRGDVRVTNPHPFTGPSWTPEPFPVERTLQGLALSVGNLQAIRTRGTNSGVPWSLLQTVAVLSGDFRRPNVRERIRKVTLSDPTGNHISLQSRGGSSKPGSADQDVTFDASGTLFPDETAWRLRVEMAPEIAERRSELLRFHGVGDSNVKVVRADDDESGQVSTVSYPPKPLAQSSSLTKGSIGNVTVFSQPTQLQVDLTLDGTDENAVVRVTEVQDSIGNQWGPLHQQDPSGFPRDDGIQGRQLLIQLQPKGEPRDAVPPFVVTVEVLLPTFVDFFVPVVFQ